MMTANFLTWFLLVCISLFSTKSVARRSNRRSEKIPQWRDNSDPTDNTNLSYRFTGERMTFRCSAGGYPRPKIMWLKNGFKLSADMSHRIRIRKYNLKLTDLVLTDSGNYTCIVVNKIGNIQWNHELVVKDLYVYPQNVTTVIGGTANFFCSFNGKQNYNILWKSFYPNGVQRHFKDENFPLKNKRDKLRIENVTYQDQGKYICWVISKFSIETFSVWLTVSDKISSTQIILMTTSSEKVPSTRAAEKMSKSFVVSTFTNIPESTKRQIWTSTVMIKNRFFKRITFNPIIDTQSPHKRNETTHIYITNKLETTRFPYKQNTNLAKTGKDNVFNYKTVKTFDLDRIIWKDNYKSRVSKVNPRRNKYRHGRKKIQHSNKADNDIRRNNRSSIVQTQNHIPIAITTSKVISRNELIPDKRYKIVNMQVDRGVFVTYGYGKNKTEKNAAQTNFKSSIDIWTIYVIVGSLSGAIVLIGIVTILVSVLCNNHEEPLYKMTTV